MIACLLTFIPQWFLSFGLQDHLANVLPFDSLDMMKDVLICCYLQSTNVFVHGATYFEKFRESHSVKRWLGAILSFSFFDHSWQGLETDGAKNGTCIPDCCCWCNLLTFQQQPSRMGQSRWTTCCWHGSGWRDLWPARPAHPRRVRSLTGRVSERAWIWKFVCMYIYIKQEEKKIHSFGL